jgi:lipopolysaccharide transport system ATP-binding protein
LAAHAEQLSPLNVGFHLKDRLGQVIIGTNLKKMSTSLTPHPPEISFICRFRFRLQIAPGEYSLDVAVAEYILEAKTIYDWINGAIAFTIERNSISQKQDGLCRPDMTVSIHNCDVIDLISTDAR